MLTITTILFIGLYSVVNGFQAEDLFNGDACVLLDGTPGVCKPAKKCIWLKSEINSGRISLDGDDLEQLRCAFEGLEAITCCGDEKPLTGPRGPTIIQNAKMACDYYTTLRTPPITFLIIGGNFSFLGEFPHMAAIGYITDINNKSIDYKCGGSLISERYVLTAGHCGATSFIPVIVRLGTTNILDATIEHGVAVDVQIKQIILHPGYKSPLYYNDIALLHLKQEVPFSVNLHPACLRTDLRDLLPSDELFVTGWGRIDANNDKRSNFLMKTNLTAINLEKCNETLKSHFNRKLNIGLIGGQFCAYDPEGKKDSCHGDSGGPIQVIEKGTQMPYIVGVTSFGIHCATQLPSVYTRVAFYIDWIESIVWSN